MDKNNDGVVTMDEFLETCQKVFFKIKSLSNISNVHYITKLFLHKAIVIT